MSRLALADPTGHGFAAVARPVPGVTVHVCRLDDDTDVALALAPAVLSEAELTRAARFRFERDRNRYVRAHLFTRFCLAEATGLPAETLAFATYGNGKPVLSPESATCFNLSHSAGLAVLAVSAAGPVGIDLELEDRRLDPLKLGQAVFTEAENAALAALPRDELLRRFMQFWTAKEARMKLTGEGMSLPPRSIALDLADGRAVGYSAPSRPRARLDLVDLGLPGTHCTLASFPRD